VAGRNYVPPPDSALAPNVPPGREFWNNWRGDDADEPGPLPVQPAIVDLSKPNLTRLGLAEQLYVVNLNAGQDAVTARANADARALQMIP
jgi:hypothetical protein